ncbi:RNA polymerase sigma factor [Kribbella sp. DT2]|uniref:RNA polymerase sigma factor n=1 Tax=Kribbella sp. DT2 TaxID=3393427 RepID=UPI003CE84D81
MNQIPTRSRLGGGSVVDRPADERQARFEALFTAYRAQILGYLVRRTDTPEAAADLLAETFVIAWRRLDDIPGDALARSWLYGVARRVLANHRRGEGRRHALTHRLRDELTLTLPAQEDSRTLQLFRQLSEADQELLALVAWEELDTASIAVVLGCSRNAVRIRLHRAKRRFAKLAHTPFQTASSGEATHEGA